MQNVSNNTILLSDYQTKQGQFLYLNGIANEFSNQIMTGLGVIGVSCSFFTMATILLSKPMRTKNCYLIMFGLACADFVENLAFMRLGISRMLLYSMKQAVVYSMYECMWIDSIRAFVPPLSKGFFFMCATDRFMAVYKPHWYNTAYPRWLFPLMVMLNFLQALLEVFVMFLGASKEILIPFCGYTTATTPNLLTVLATKNTILTIVSLFVYLSTIALVYRRLGKVKKEGGNVQEAKKEMQTKVVWTLAMMLGAYSLTSLASSICYKYFFTESVQFQIRVAPVANTTQQLSPVSDFTVFMWRNKDFRHNFLKWFCFRQNHKVASSTFVKGSQNGISTRITKKLISAIDVKPMINN